MKTFILIQLLLCLGLLYLLKPRNRRRRANPGHPARRFNDRVENCTTIEQPVIEGPVGNPLTRHVRQLSDDQLRNALKSTRHAESYGKSTAGQRMLLALEEETNRRADLQHPAEPVQTAASNEDKCLQQVAS